MGESDGLLGMLPLLSMALVFLLGWGWLVQVEAETFAYVTNRGSDNVSVIRTSDNTVVTSLGVGDAPNKVAVTPDGAFAYVTNWMSDNVSVIRTSDNTVVATVTGGFHPTGLAITPDGAFAYVANEVSGNVSVIRTSDNTVVATVPVGSLPQGVAITPDGAFAYVANINSGNVSVIRTYDNTAVTTVTVRTYPEGVAITPDGAFAYVTNQGSDNVSVIRTSDNTVVATVTVGGGPGGVAIRPTPPVSATLFISPPSGNYVTTQRFDLTLILKASALSAIGGNATLDGTDVTASLGGCIKPGTLIEGGQTFRCPDIKIKDVLSPGSHTFSVTLDLSDGSSVRYTVIWEVLSNTEP